MCGNVGEHTSVTQEDTAGTRIKCCVYWGILFEKGHVLLRIRNLKFRNVSTCSEQVTLFGKDEEALWPAQVEDLSQSVSAGSGGLLVFRMVKQQTFGLCMVMESADQLKM